MFGNVTSSWANPQQNQQQQGTSAFGQPSAFGATNTTNAFGSTSAFGQPQQQQPQANPMFGNLSTPANNAGTSGFGGFGSTANNTTSAFGAKPATGFGAFGGGTFGGGATTSAFGQPANTSTTGTSLFGQPAASTGTTSTFGSTGLFGQSKPSVFGATTTSTNPPLVTTGTANPPYAAHSEKDGNATLQYQSISCMPQYVGYSFEELRLQDYGQNRKTASAGSTFGSTTSAFGATQPTSGLFGATQPAQPQQSTTPFGTTTTAPTSTFGGFGTNTNTTTQPSGGLFGNTAFGTNTAQQPAQQTSAFGSTGFGTQPQQQQSTGLFGNTGFGNTAANKPAFGGFGTTPATTTSAFGGGGAFGNTQNQAQPAQTTSLFGNTQPAATTNAFVGNTAFGNTATKPLFGGTTTTAQPATTTFGGFGANTQQQQQPAQQGGGLFGGGGGLFGNTQQQQQQQQPQQQGQTTSLFGNTNNTQQAGGGIFGGGGLFGNTQQNQQQNQQQQQPSLGLFGQNKTTTAPAGGSLFGSGTFGQQQSTTNTQPGGGLFGGNTLGQSTNQQAGFGGGLFGKPAAPALGTSMSTTPGGLFGSTLGNSTNTLNASAMNQSAQGTLTASISQPIGSNLPIFSMLPPGPRLVDLEQPKKKAPFFVDVPARSPIPRNSQSFAPASSKLRGFGSSTNGPTNPLGNPFTSNSSSFLGGKPNALSLTDSRSSSVGPDSFLGRSGSPALGSGTRQSVKKVILDKKVEPSQLFVKSGSPGLPGSKIVFSPALSIAARESEAAAAATNSNSNAHLDSPTPTPRIQQRSPARFSSQSTKNAGKAADVSDSTALDEGDYYVKPDLATLKKLGYDELSAFKGLIVGRVGYGEIEFLEPVDLTGLPKLGALLGEVIHFEDKECSVYPDNEDADKPPPGSGLNVKAKLTLEHCWAVDKATREPIKDPEHPSVVKHLKRLKNMKDTHFVNFDMKAGKWTFTVDHF